MLREPDEINLTTKQEQEFIEARIKSERELMLIATIDGKYVGNCALMSVGRYKRCSHRCEIAIALYKDYCGCGIGKLLMETVLSMAKSLGYEQAELEVISDNKGAIILYEKLGFQKYGHFPHNMKYADGTYADADWMMKIL